MGDKHFISVVALLLVAVNCAVWFHRPPQSAERKRELRIPDPAITIPTHKEVVAVSRQFQEFTVKIPADLLPHEHYVLESKSCSCFDAKLLHDENGLNCVFDLRLHKSRETLHVSARFRSSLEGFPDAEFNTVVEIFPHISTTPSKFPIFTLDPDRKQSFDLVIERVVDSQPTQVEASSSGPPLLVVSTGEKKLVKYGDLSVEEFHVSLSLDPTEMNLTDVKGTQTSKLTIIANEQILTQYVYWMISGEVEYFPRSIFVPRHQVKSWKSRIEVYGKQVSQIAANVDEIHLSMTNSPDKAVINVDISDPTHITNGSHIRFLVDSQWHVVPIIVPSKSDHRATKRMHRES